jgi:2-polyprenyl-3-methyl-5-hydroxy-6-metoxy-1,4-benzoquinol methylase
VNRATDNCLSIARREFVWVDTEVPEAHNYLAPPTVKALRELRARAVLDLGCGNGSFSGLLQSQGFQVTGCDARRRESPWHAKGTQQSNSSSTTLNAHYRAASQDLMTWNTLSSHGI